MRGNFKTDRNGSPIAYGGPDSSTPKFADHLGHCLSVVRTLGGLGFPVSPVARSYRVRA
jgi:hypothetical protein